MPVQQIKIIWCDITFENLHSYASMQNDFNRTTTGMEEHSANTIDVRILSEGREQIRSNEVPLVAVQTIDDALREIKQNLGKKVFVICSGSMGHILIREIAEEYPLIHTIYIYTHNILNHLDWADRHREMVRMFDHHTDLLLRLTRDISLHYIEQGQMLLTENAARQAWAHFTLAQKLEQAANQREKKNSNSGQPEFRERLKLLEGEHGLISQADRAMRTQEYSLENS